ncbi:hypothetical protein ACUXV3_19150 (plasmid) [Roseobacteraceae bacterium NS-SX3]
MRKEHLAAGHLCHVEGAEPLTLPCHLIHRAGAPKPQIEDVRACLKALRKSG